MRSNPRRKMVHGLPPNVHRIALEPRALFDGAGLATMFSADASLRGDQDSQANTRVASARSEKTTSDGIREGLLDVGLASREASEARALLVIDARVQDVETILSSLKDGVDVVRIGRDEAGLAKILQTLSQGNYSSISVLAHSQGVGQLMLGNQMLDSSSLSQYSVDLTNIGNALSGAKDILLYACDLAAEPNGLEFLTQLANATGADIAASTNLTGNAALGGDWLLEASVGSIESAIGVQASALTQYEHVLVGTPTVALSGGGNALIGGNFSVTATFDNVGADAGFLPYVDLFVPRNGVDGGGSPDGLSVTSATYLGQAITPTVITLTAADIAAGQVTHPLFQNSSGSRLVSIPSGFGAGDQLLVYQLPLGSFAPAQPAANLIISGTVSNLADVGTPLNLQARGGFALGNDALNNPASDPSLSSGLTSIAVTPQLYTVTTTYIGPENETATGSNFPRAYRVDVDVAEGQTLTNLDLSSILSPGMQYVPISGTPASVSGFSVGATPTSGWTNVNGVLVSGPSAADATPSTTVPGGTVTRELSSVTGAAGIDASMVVQFYVPQNDASSAAILNAASGDDVFLTAGTAVSGNWDPIDPRDSVTPISQTITNAHVLEAQSQAIQKLGNIVSNFGPSGASPGDIVRYTLDLQISDYFGLGGNPSGQDLLVTDTLSDGLLFLDATTSPSATNPSFAVTRNGASELYTLVRGVNYTVNFLADGRQQIVFNLRSALPAGIGSMLLGDLFAGDTVAQGGTTAQIIFDTQILDAYRIGPANEDGDASSGSGQNSINEGDRLVNNAIFAGTVLTPALDPNLPGLQIESDNTRANLRVSQNTVTIEAIALNGSLVSPVVVTPGDSVTYCLTYVVPTGDFENFGITAFLPLPLYNVADPDGNGTPNALIQQLGPFASIPSVGSYSIQAIGGDGSGLSSPVVVTQDGVSNSLTFFLNDRSDLSNQPLTINICYTLRSLDQPFADNLSLVAQANASNNSTAGVTQSSDSLSPVTVSVPSVSIIRGVVGENVNEASSTFDPVFSAGNPASLIRGPGDLSANPLLGTLTAANVSANLNSDISNVDAGDTLRLATTLVNTGSGPRGAFDVTVIEALPSNLDPATVTNLRVVRGDGTAVAFTGSLATLFTTGITLIDPSSTQGAIGSGVVGGVPVTDGSNIVIITYDAQVIQTSPVNLSAAATAAVTNYSGQDNGTNYVPTSIQDNLTVATPLPLINKIITATDQTYTSGNDVVIGEIVTYQVTVTVPEGATPNASFVDVLDSNLTFVALDSVTVTPGLVFTSGAPSAASAVFSDTAGGNANRLSLTIGNIQNNDTDNASAQTITFVYRAVVSNVLGNQQTTLQNNTAQLEATNVSVFAQAPDVRVVEPNVSISNTPSVTVIDNGDTVTYTIVISSNGLVPAFDVNLADTLPAGMTLVGGSLNVSGGPAPSTPVGFTGSNLSGSWSQLAVGDTITITYSATVSNTSTLGQTLDHTASVDWSSLPGLTNNNLSALTSVADTERTGSGGVNDYAANDNAPVTVAAQPPVLTLVQTSEGTSTGANVVPGEVVRYRMVVQIPETTAGDFRLSPQLPSGIRFLNDGTSTVGFISNSGVTSTNISGAGLNIIGGGNTASDVTGLAPTFALPGGFIVDGSGTALAAGVLADGSSPVFRLGDLFNTDTDADREFVVIEFNAVIDNSAATASGNTRDVNFTVQANGSTQATSNTVTISEQEPLIASMDKRVVSVSGNQVTYEVTFTNTGNATAHDVVLTDPFAGAVNTTFGGSSSVSGLPVGATNNSSATGLNVLIPTLAIGESVTIRYVGVVTDLTQSVPARDATVTYTSLNESNGKTLAVTTTTGVVTSTSNGERTGNIADYGTTQNDYRATDPAGVGVISGRLWDDTATYDQAITAGEAFFAGRTVNLLWAGVDGVFGNGDDQTFTTTTSSVAGQEGMYSFGAAPAGNYRISTGTSFVDPSVGAVQVYTDAGGGVGTDGVITLTLGDAQASTNQNFGFVEINDPPTVIVPASVSVNEDVVLAFTGANLVSVGDIDAGSSTTNLVTLNVSNGSLNITSVPGVVVTGNNSGNVTLTGSLTDINTALASLTYQANANFSGNDTLLVRVDDRGNGGDAPGGNLVPREPVADNLFATASVPIAISPLPDPPTATTSTRSTNEDTPISGNTLFPSPAQVTAGDVGDSDPDLPYGDTIAVQGVAAGTVSGPITGGLGSAVPGTYGSLVLNNDGSYTYTPGAGAQALPAGQTAVDTFTYTIVDTTGRTSTAQIIINLTGVNDNVAAAPDVRIMNEDDPPISGNAVGGISGPGGQTGDARDPDPDADVVTVQGLALGNVAGPVVGNVGGVGVTGAYGTLVINSDGTYTYTPDPVFTQPLVDGQRVNDVFTYTVRDPSGTTATTTITISIDGSNDSINALPDLRVIPEPNPSAGVTVIGNALAPSPGQTALGDGQDTTVDPFPLSISGINAGTLTGIQTGNVGAPIVGQYGSIVIAADGSYVYTPNANAQTIAAGQTVNDVFTYTVTNGQPGGFATTRITIRMIGENDPITARPDLDAIASTALLPVQGNVISAVAPTGSSAQLLSDTDIDTNDIPRVVGVVSGLQATSVSGQISVPVPGQYGNLVLNPDGTYSYTVNNTNSAVLALNQGETLTEVYTYTISDANGSLATTTLSIVINGAYESPIGADRTFTISEDLTNENGTPLRFTPADFGFSDPDQNDALTQLVINSLPASGVLSINGTPVVVGQVLTLAQIAELQYVPALNTNRDTLNNNHPTFDFTVVDRTGLRDATPNRITIIITPVNDPSIAQTITRVIDSDAILSQPSSQIIGLPRPTDVDEPLQTLSVSVASVPNPSNQGQFFRPDGTPVLAGETLSLQDLQNLRFVPSPLLTGTPDAQGLLSAGSLVYRVTDGNGGSADGQVNINVRLVSTSNVVAQPFKPVLINSPLRIQELSPEIIRQELQRLQSGFDSGILGSSAIAPTIDLSAGGYFQEGRWNSNFNDERLGQLPPAPESSEPTAAAVPDPNKDKAVRSSAAEALDCPPEKLPPPKPIKRVMKFVQSDAPKFTEQLSHAKKRFKLPTKVRPVVRPPGC